MRIVPVQRPRQQVEGQLRLAILEGHIREGERLPSENALAESFSVSRATIREALRSLAEVGLVAKGAGATSGLYAQSVDHNALSRLVVERLTNVLDVGSVTPTEVVMFRDLLEIPSARLAARNRQEEDLTDLHALIDRERAITFDDPAVPELNARFHCVVARASSNRVLFAFVSALHRTTRPLEMVHTDAHVGKNAVMHHISIHRAISERDPAAAELAMRSHLCYLAAHSSDDADTVIAL